MDPFVAMVYIYIYMVVSRNRATPQSSIFCSIFPSQKPRKCRGTPMAMETPDGVATMQAAGLIRSCLKRNPPDRHLGRAAGSIDVCDVEGWEKEKFWIGWNASETYIETYRNSRYSLWFVMTIYDYHIHHIRSSWFWDVCLSHLGWESYHAGCVKFRMVDSLLIGAWLLQERTALCQPPIKLTTSKWIVSSTHTLPAKRIKTSKLTSKFTKIRQISPCLFIRFYC